MEQLNRNAIVWASEAQEDALPNELATLGIKIQPPPMVAALIKAFRNVSKKEKALVLREKGWGRGTSRKI